MDGQTVKGSISPAPRLLTGGIGSFVSRAHHFSLPSVGEAFCKFTASTQSVCPFLGSSLSTPECFTLRNLGAQEVRFLSTDHSLTFCNGLFLWDREDLAVGVVCLLLPISPDFNVALTMGFYVLFCTFPSSFKPVTLPPVPFFACISMFPSTPPCLSGIFCALWSVGCQVMEQTGFHG